MLRRRFVLSGHGTGLGTGKLLIWLAVASLVAALGATATGSTTASASTTPSAAPATQVVRQNRLPAGDPVVRLTVTLSGQGYWLAGSDGGVFPFGDAGRYGSMAGVALSQPVVGMAVTPTGRGYWLVARDGGIFAFGDARFYGSTAGLGLAQPVVGMAATPTGAGYWLVAADGAVFRFGDAGAYGSMAGVALAQPVVGMAATSTGRGYWLVARDGGIFTFGDAGFHGSMRGVPLARPVVGMAATATGRGYWLVAADGGIFTFGDAAFFGSMGGYGLDRPVVSMAAVPTGTGYWMATGDGAVFNFGAARFYGSVTPAGPLRVAEYGDGLAMQAAPFFNLALAKTITRDVQYGGASICTWLNVMAQDAAAFRPEAVVLEFVGDSFSPCMNGVQPFTAAFYTKYQADAQAAIATFARIGAHVYIAGYPIMLPTASNPLSDHLNQVLAGVAAASPDASFVSAGSAVENNGAFTFSLPCLYFEPCANQPSPGLNLVRDPAGTHFCPTNHGVVQGFYWYCDVWSSGAFRYGAAMASGVTHDFGR